MTRLLQRTFPSVIVLSSLVQFTALVWASPGASDATVVQLVQAQLPGGIRLDQADGEMVGRAVSRTILDHRTQAPTILSVALKSGTRREGTKNKEAAKRSCEFVVQVFKAALLAAPEQASTLTEAAAALYPDCTDALAAVVLHCQAQRLAAYDYKDRHDYKDRADYKDTSDYKDTVQAPVAGISDLGDRFAGLTPGIGFGPGFPGAPGFVGSPPSGSVALPPVALPNPSPSPVTAVVNE